jgi:hypothetical protein
MSYAIVRHYANYRAHPKRTIRVVQTEAEAQQHCGSPEASSETCTTAAGKRRTRERGPWFDGYYRR